MQTMSRREKERIILARRELKIRRARLDFWEYCKTDSPEFYKEDRWHLKLFAWTLQALYERCLTKDTFIPAMQEIAPNWFIESFEREWLEDGRTYKKIIINLPPRMGKSRTLVLFCQWILGQDQSNKIITCSYNDDQATEFSRFTRDGISKERAEPLDVVFNDIFPTAKMSEGNAAYQKWALDGHFFNYKGAGVGGSITGKGANVLIVDDPVKDAATALNTNALNRLWEWYSGTFISRKEEGGLQIINHTRWSKKDIAGRVLAKENKKDWFILKMEAKTGEHMLCAELLSEESYNDLRISILPEIFQANYHQRPIDLAGRLYTNFKTYTDIPVNPASGKELTEEVIGYVDTADMGTDHLAGFIAKVIKGQAYIIDTIFTKEPMEKTEPLTARKIYDNKVNRADIESNNGGRGFGRQVEHILWQDFKSRNTSIRKFHQSQNKRARILTNATWIMDNVLFPVNWADRWPDLAEALNNYQKEGTNQHDDAPDALTGLSEMIRSSGTIRVDFL